MDDQQDNHSNDVGASNEHSHHDGHFGFGHHGGHHHGDGHHEHHHDGGQWNQDGQGEQNENSGTGLAASDSNSNSPASNNSADGTFNNQQPTTSGSSTNWQSSSAPAQSLPQQPEQPVATVPSTDSQNTQSASADTSVQQPTTGGSSTNWQTPSENVSSAQPSVVSNQQAPSFVAPDNPGMLAFSPTSDWKSSEDFTPSAPSTIPSTPAVDTPSTIGSPAVSDQGNAGAVVETPPVTNPVVSTTPPVVETPAPVYGGSVDAGSGQDDTSASNPVDVVGMTGAS